MSFGSIDKISSVPEKSFEKLKQFDELKDNSNQAETKQNSHEFAKLLDKSPDVAMKSTETSHASAQNSQIGDKILDAIQGVKSNIDNQSNKVNDLLGSSDALSLKDMLKTQKAMSNLMLTQELVGKVAGKSTQIFETMLKQQ
ncbi:MAG: hypothetical protein HAW62_05905 [Endozoicomonadaceae bacterium]|nr:hypothetical protein [Endozoicomonadaceae bacterium]